MEENVVQIKELFKKTDVSLSRTGLMRWDSHLNHAQAFWYKIWISNGPPQNLCCACKRLSCQGVSQPSGETSERLRSPYSDYETQAGTEGRRLDIIKIKFESEDALATFNIFCTCFPRQHNPWTLWRREHRIEGECSYHREKIYRTIQKLSERMMYTEPSMSCTQCRLIHFIHEKK